MLLVRVRADSCEACVLAWPGGVGVLCAPKFGALMRDTLRPDALPASPVGTSRGARTARHPARLVLRLAGFSLCLAGFFHILYGFRVSCCTSLSFVQCFAV